MDKSIVIQFAENDEEKTLLSHIADLAERSRQRSTVESGSFLPDSLKMRAEVMLRTFGYTDFFFWGGYDEAERTCPVFFTDYCGEALIKDEPTLAGITFARAELDRFNKDASLSHRDVLGALMGLGIERDKVGDISIVNGGAIFALKESISPFVSESLEKIGRYPVKIILDPSLRPQPSCDFEECFDTVASLRLDAVVASVFNTSRSIAADAIASGMVSVNGALAKKADLNIKQGDKISYRGNGRAQIEKTDGFSKKGRIRVLYKKYR